MASSSQPNLPANNGGPSSWPRADSALTREAKAQHEAHPTRRIFVGPMPEKVISQIENEVKKKENTGVITLNQLEDEAPDRREDIMNVVKNHAKRFVEHYHYRSDGRRGGDGDGESKTGSRTKRKRSVEDAESHVSSFETENWDEDYDEQNLAEELIRKWRESEWGQAWKNRGKKNHKSTTSHWIGGSFEIGTLLGVNLLNPPAPNPSAVSLRALTANASASKSVQDLGPPSPITPSGQSNVDSKTGLLAVPGRSSHSESPATGSKDKGKQRVHYALPSPEIPETLAPLPLPPLEVLSRTESALDPTSSQAAMLSPAMPSPGLQWGDIVMRGNCL